MPLREQLIADLQGEQDYGVLLVAQIGGAPNELQLIIETAAYDEAVQGLRPKAAYIIRALGVREHRLHLGVFGGLAFPDEHPLLLHHNTPKVAVHFNGKPAIISDAVLDVYQAYVSTFGPWRNVAELSDDLNLSVPLTRLLGFGAGLLGVMPKPLAERMQKALAGSGLTVSLAEDASFETVDEHGRSRLAKLLLLDTSYVVALDFSVEKMQGRG
ncbi:hypothetical protein FBR02_08440 [Anaerolineae bacterium CFX9]|nr:hypothetical protein [Anaerolineae bacterium CFX9]